MSVVRRLPWAADHIAQFLARQSAQHSRPGALGGGVCGQQPISTTSVRRRASESKPNLGHTASVRSHRRRIRRNRQPRLRHGLRYRLGNWRAWEGKAERGCFTDRNLTCAAAERGATM